MLIPLNSNVASGIVPDQINDSPAPELPPPEMDPVIFNDEEGGDSGGPLNQIGGVAKVLRGRWAPGMTPSPDQWDAVCRVKEIARTRGQTGGSRTATLVGPAGSGKTFLMQLVAAELAAAEFGFDAVVFLAPTGKAASRLAEVLGGRPITTSTIHRVLYGPPMEPYYLKTQYDRLAERWTTTVLTKRDVIIETDHARKDEVDSAKAQGVTEESGSWKRELPKPEGIEDRSALEQRDAKRASKIKFGAAKEPCDVNTLIICDEASMVGREVHDDLMSMLPEGCFLLYVGDREQLPPVNAAIGPDFANPTAALTQVHRQALDNPVLRVATEIRLRRGGLLNLIRPTDAPALARSSMPPEAWLYDRQQRGREATLICFTNKMRDALNAGVRARRGSEPRTVNLGDRFLVRANAPDLGVMNGEVLEVIEALPFGDHHSKFRAKGRADHVVFFVNRGLIGAEQGDFRRWVAATTRDWVERNRNKIEAGMLDEATDNPFRRYIHVDYGEALTCHASQGSEWADVGIVWEGALWGVGKRDPDFIRQWSYTALTRARQTCTVFGG